MRKIDKKPILVFAFLFVPATLGAILTTVCIINFMPIGEYKSIAKVLVSIPMVFFLNIIMYRLFLWKMPLKEGEYKEGSKDEFIYNVYVLYNLLLFNMLTPALLIPIPLMRTIYIALGASFGENTYCSGVIFDPPLVQLGDNTIIGFDAVLCPHIIEGKKLSFSKITVGNNVTIGMRSIIMAGVIIEDEGIVAAGSVVKKDTYIKSGEVWGGIPAKLLKPNINLINIEEIKRNTHQAS